MAIWWYRAVDPPVPIPHTVVTRRSTDPTEGATPWEHRPLPDRSFVFLRNYSGLLRQQVSGRRGLPLRAWLSAAKMGWPCLRRVEM